MKKLIIKGAKNIYIKVKNEKFFYKKVRWVNCKFTEAKIDFIDYKDTSLLKYCLSERFKIMLGII